MSERVQPLFEARGPDADAGCDGLPRREVSSNSGVLPREQILALIRRKMIASVKEIEEEQVQPASLDLRLGSMAYRVRASFLPGLNSTVDDQLSDLTQDIISLEDGAVLNRGCVYVIPLLEYLNLPESIFAAANPKSSTGRLDVFTRLITDRTDVFDTVRANYEGRLYAEISPRSFNVRVRQGSRLNQIRFRRRAGPQARYGDFRLTDRELQLTDEQFPLTDGQAVIRNGLNLSVSLRPENGSKLIGYRAQRFADIVDVDQVGKYKITDFWEKITSQRGGRLILDPDQFYILASKEALHIPPHLAAEMVPIDPTMGEFRVHYAGFFDPGFGHAPAGGRGSKAVLEVRSHEVPFILEDGQNIGRLIYERLTETPSEVYGQGIGSHYQAQGLKLSKHFK